MNKVVVFAPLFPPAFRGGGPIRSTAALVANTPPGIVPYVITADCDLGVSERLPVDSNQWTVAEGAACWYSSVDRARHYIGALRAARAIKADIIYLNSFMNPRFSIVPMVLAKFGFWNDALLLVAPRGEFGAAALAHKALKKKFYVSFVKFLRLHSAVVWHSTARHESADIRALWGESTRIIKRENDSLVKPQVSKRRPSGSRVRAVFVSRMTELKGLHVLLKALSNVAAPVTLDVIGPEEVPDYANYCRELAANMPDHVTVNFIGPIDAPLVVQKLQDYDIFMFPTAGENFGHVVAEALAAGCQVMITPSTPWTEVVKGGGGVVVPSRDPSIWSAAIDEYCGLGAASRDAGSLAAQEAYSAWLSRKAEPHVWQTALEFVQASR